MRLHPCLPSSSSPPAQPVHFPGSARCLRHTRWQGDPHAPHGALSWAVVFLRSYRVPAAQVDDLGFKIFSHCWSCPAADADPSPRATGATLNSGFNCNSGFRLHSWRPHRVCDHLRQASCVEKQQQGQMVAPWTSPTCSQSPSTQH